MVNTCNQCHKDMGYRDMNISGFRVGFCNNPKCPNYAIIQVAAEQMPKEDNNGKE